MGCGASKERKVHDESPNPDDPPVRVSSHSGKEQQDFGQPEVEGTKGTSPDVTHAFAQGKPDEGEAPSPHTMDTKESSNSVIKVAGVKV